MRIKNALIRVKAGPENGLAEGQFTAYASTFTRTPDSYGDVVAPGAFTNTLAEWAAKDAPIPLLFGHRMDDPDFNIGHIVSAAEDEHGLLVKAELDLENPKAAQTYRLLKGRRIDQMSFAYDVLDEGQVEIDGQKANELRELSLYELSVVPLGANRETEILAVKAQADALVAGMKAGRVLAQKHIDSLRSAQEAIGAVIAAAEADQDKASGTGDANAKEPFGANAEELSPNPSARALAELHLLALV